ncbi:MAG: D-glycero-D-manno-heptose 1,7-bisphosphate phosphatase [Solirubrobacteraceae bacterium]|nr:D-glycero-D-manno-heptose 1,7-bisphosphate phosphatase [Solirubrobacteraceae bacterium]
MGSGGARRARRPAAFVDRDGVITEPVLDPRSETYESPLESGQTALAPGAADGLRELQRLGFAVVVVSNQPAAAKGTVSLPDLAEVHHRAVALLGGAGVEIDGWRYCFHHPDGVVAELRRACECRKPRPGLITAAAAALDIDLARSWVIGDADTDVLAGQAAGCSTILVEHPRTAHRRLGAALPDARARDLHAAAAALARVHAAL